MPAAYVFVDRWFVPAPVEDVYDAIGSPLDYPKWWGDVFPETGGEGPPRPGRRNTITARGFLPYKLHFVTEVTEAVRPRTIALRLEGDFEGGGSWTFEEVEGGGTSAVLDWRPIVQKAGVKHLTPVLRPLFRANHNWTMRCGQAHIVDYLASRSSTAARDPGRSA